MKNATLKKLISACLFLAVFVSPSYSISYVSAASGAWTTAATWSPAGVPGAADDVTIALGHNVSNNATTNCRDLTVTGTLSASSGMILYIRGNYVVNGTETGSGAIAFYPGTGTTISGTGNFSNNIRYTFSANRTISSNVTCVKAVPTGIPGTTVTNLGNITLDLVNTTTGATWVNSTNSTLSLKVPGFMSGMTFNATATGNTVNILYNTGALPTPTGFYNLTLMSTTGSKNLAASINVLNTLTINPSNVLNTNGFNITIGGNWVNNGGFTPTTSTVNFNGAGAQSFGGASNTSFFNLTKSGAGTTTLAKNMFVTNLCTISAGILNVGTNGLSGAGGLTQTNGELRIAKLATVLPELAGTYTLSGGKVNFSGAGAQTIRSGVSFFNIDVTGSGTKSLAGALTMTGSLLISSTLDVTASNFAVNIGRNLTNNGTFTTRTATVTLNGTLAQVISGTSTTTFENLTLSNTAGASITSGTYIVNGVLTLSNGNFNTNGNSFTLTSTASQTARIAPLAGTGSMSGNFIIQRFIATRDTTWADLSSPVQGSTFADWASELPAVYYGYAPPTSYPTQYTYSESADDFVPVTSAATALTPGKGFEVFMSGDFSYSNLPNTTINTVGIPNQGNQNLSSQVSFSGAGSNLVGNPFASSISWSAVRAASARLLNTYDVYDFTAGNYTTFGLGTEIGSGQGFWVYSTGASPTLIINESAKTTTSNSSIRSSIQETFFTLKLSSNDLNNNYYHILKVAANDMASDGWDENDHPYHKSPNKLAPTLVSVTDGKKLTTNTFNAADENYSMPIQTMAGISGYYKLEAAGFENISDYSCIKLEDRLLNKTVVLDDAHPYAFQMNVGDEANRFVVHFSKDQNCKAGSMPESTIAEFENGINILPSSEGNLITFNLTEAANVNISVTNVLGQTIVAPMAVTVENQSVNVSIPQDFSGMYIVKIESTKGVVTKKFVRK